MHRAEEIAEDAQEIAEAAAEIAEDIAEEVSEAEEETPPDTSGIAEAIHDVSLQEQLAECLQRIAVLEERQSSLSLRTEEACLEADQAEATAELALDVALSEPVETEEPSNVQEVPLEPETEKPKEPAGSFLENLLACK